MLFYLAPVQAQAVSCCPGGSTLGQVCTRSPLVIGACRQAYNNIESIACGTNLICGLPSDPTPTPTPASTLPPGCYTVAPPIPPEDWNGVCGGHPHCIGYNVCCPNLNDCNGIIPTWAPPGPTIPVYDPKCVAAEIPGYPGRDRTGIKTGLGCLPTDPQTFVNTVLPWAVGIGSGIAFFLGLYGALMIVISAGDPEKMQAGRELITSAVVGLLLIIFAVFLLDLIGVDILKLFTY